MSQLNENNKINTLKLIKKEQSYKYPSNTNLIVEFNKYNTTLPNKTFKTF